MSILGNQFVAWMNDETDALVARLRDGALGKIIGRAAKAGDAQAQKIIDLYMQYAADMDPTTLLACKAELDAWLLAHPEHGGPQA